VKSKEIRELGDIEMKTKMDELENELLKARSQSSIGSKGTVNLRVVKKSIARIKTIINERALKNKGGNSNKK